MWMLLEEGNQGQQSLGSWGGLPAGHCAPWTSCLCQSAPGPWHLSALTSWAAHSVYRRTNGSRPGLLCLRAVDSGAGWLPGGVLDTGCRAAALASPTPGQDTPHRNTTHVPRSGPGSLRQSLPTENHRLTALKRCGTAGPGAQGLQDPPPLPVPLPRPRWIPEAPAPPPQLRFASSTLPQAPTGQGPLQAAYSCLCVPCPQPAHPDLQGLSDRGQHWLLPSMSLLSPALPT
ncbi:hypothetical protein H1C71_007703 [Ictidomys tridecemlineatus]|nr:hypothetical protein H1C71_007703 [Ictidomys tridecemlineatus]